MQGVIHYNPNLSHQVDHAKAFQACGFGATSSPDDDADIHVISGPWFAMRQWKGHPHTLMIDRAWWDDPDCVSIGWLQKDGTRRYATGDKPRPKPLIYKWKENIWGNLGEHRCLILADYGQDVSDIVGEAMDRFNTVNVRPHPADRKSIISLDDDIGWHDVVIGTSGSAIFNAIQLGIPTICLDSKNECAPVCSDSISAELYRGSRKDWLHDMSYKQWSLDEIASGEAWERLKEIM